jgi:cell division inhibitor SepF
VAVSDSWHKALVYFGLAEERDDTYADDEDDDYRPARSSREREPDPEPEYRERPNVRRISSRRRSRDDFDDIFADDEPPTRANLRPIGGGAAPAKARNGGSVKLHLVIPKSFNDAQQVADKFKDDIPVVLNLQSTDTDLSKRLIDFASGLTYALDGGMQRVADRVFMLTPRNVEISAEERAQLIEKGFFNQS